MPNLDTTINDLAIASGMDLVVNWSACRWGFAGGTLLLALLIACLCHALHGRWPHWLQSVGLMVALALLFWAPLDVLRRARRPWPAAALLRPPFTAQALLIRDALYCVPHGLIFGVPAVATLIQLGAKASDGWLWTEWVSAVSAHGVGSDVAGDGGDQRHPGLAGTVWSGLVWFVWLLVVSTLSAFYCMCSVSGGAAKIPPS